MKYRVLIVDDSRLARMSIARVLGQLQPEWTRVEATNADEAVACVKQNDIDVALLDFNMPGRDGLELAAELHALKPLMPLALISANIQTAIIAQAHEAGAAFLPKPLTEEALAEFLLGAKRQLTATQR